MKYDVLGIGNAIVDTEIRINTDFLIDNHLQKGLMSLVSSDEQSHILSQFDEHQQNKAAGGSAANTVVGISQFGGSTSFIGKVGADKNGQLYQQSMTSTGVDFTPAIHEAEPTGTCVVLVSPDGERTMQTNLAASSTLAPEDIKLEAVLSSNAIYVEGYLFSSALTESAASNAMEMAKAHGIKVALTLSDPGIVANFKSPLNHAVENYTDILFCNEHEAEIFSDFESRTDRLQAIGSYVDLVFMTCGADGTMIFDNGQVHSLPGHVVNVVDTTGAGDIFAAGVLFGLSKNMNPLESAQLGLFASAKIVTQRGPRLKSPIATTIDSILQGAHPSRS